MELHKAWVPVDLIKQAKEDVLANRAKTFENQNRINLSEITSKAVSDIAEHCSALAVFPWRVDRSGAQIHEKMEDSAQTWHQDIIALQGTEGCTVWVPLDPIDGTRPTIAFGGEMDALVHDFDKRQFSYAAKPPTVTAAIVVLNMELGDVAIFSWNELHRTWWTPDMTNTRISLDLRYTPRVL